MINLARCRGAEYGGKAASLGMLTRAAFNVQPGIALAWNEPDHSTLELFNELVRAIGSLKVTIHSKWAVRSSALGEDSDEHSFAGQHETLLNVECWELEQAVRDVKASAFNERSRCYRRDRGINTGPKMGVIIQRMVPNVVMSAVVFTNDPITKTDDVVVECTEGLGDKLVGGEVDPEGWVISRLVLDQSSRVKPPHPVYDLVRDALQVEKLYGKPVDIEAARDSDGEWWLCQARPITTI